MLTTLFSRLVLTFGDRPLPAKSVAEEIVFGILLVLPLGIMIGHLTVRVCCRPPQILLQYIRADVWNTVVRLLVADLMMEILLPSIQCLPLYDDFGYSVSMLLQNYGLACPTPPAETAIALSPVATGIIFAMRLVFVCLGVHVGESFAPIVVTGGIACGKSTVVKLLQTGGKAEDPKSSSVINDGTVYLVDTDTIAHEILLPDTPDSVYDAVVEAFGTDILVGDDTAFSSAGRSRIDRRKLGNVIFQDATQRRRLNAITHPRIILVMLKRMLVGLFWSGSDLCLVDVPLLFESGNLRWLFVTIVLVGCPPATQMERLRARNPDLSKTQCQERIQSQMNIEDKESVSDLVVWNDGGYDDLENQVEQTRQELMNRVYGVGLSLLQLLIIIGGSVPLAVLSKLYSLQHSV